MSRRVGHGAARSAPFGTDVQPTTKIRIVGGKAVEIPVDSPPTSAGSHSSQKSLPPLASGPHGTPPIATQPPLQGYEEDEEEKEQVSPFIQEKNSRNLYSKTAPADKSNSHIHQNSTALPGSHKVLPPISRHSPASSGHSPLNNLPHDDFSSTSSPISQLNSPKVSFTDQLRDALDGYDPYLLKDMYSDLAEYDHRLSGYVSESQANAVALRHQLPLNTNMLKLLFSNFTKDGHAELINYEKMIQYLARAQLGSAEAETVLQESVNKFVNAPSSAHSNSSSGRGSSLQDQISKFDRDREELNQRLQHQQGRHQQQQHQLQQERQQQGRHQQQHQQLQQDRQQQHQGRQQQQQQEGLHHSRQSPHGGGGHHQQQDRWQGPPGGQRNERREDKQKQAAEKHVSTRKPLRAFSDREDAKLLMLVEQQYIHGEEPTDLVAMRNKLAAKDRTEEGTLTKKEIQDVCFALRVPMAGSLMEKLMQRCDTGDGQYSWPAFVDFLERVKPLSTDKQTGTPEPPRAKTWPMNTREESNKVPHSRAPALPQEPGPPPWETRKPLGRVIGHKSPTDVEREITRYDTHAEDDFPSSHPTSATTTTHTSTNNPNSASERNQLEALARQHRARAVQANQQRQRQRVEEEAAGERWFERFMHLAKGLYNADSTNTGYLSKEEMHRILSNYNLIYQLGFPESRIDRVISTHSTPQGMVSIEHLLETLRDQRK